uniref:Origin recognition complex subunit 1 n=1 Tax=Rhabditophanes sp. KR3021 TaxID=114890 RepID=A0AC35TW86_9BILA
MSITKFSLPFESDTTLSIELESPELEYSYQAVQADCKTIFLCGYVEFADHNIFLDAITTNLSTSYFISTNDVASDFSFTSTRDILRHAKTFIFLLNEVTLSDKHCKMCLQYAWDIQLHVLVLRPPHTQLVIYTEKKNGGADSEWDSDDDDLAEDELSMAERMRALKLDHCINFKQIQKILAKSFEKSLMYDFNRHEECMLKLRKTLRSSIPSTGRRCSERKLGTLNRPESFDSCLSNSTIKSFHKKRIVSDNTLLIIPPKRNSSKSPLKKINGSASSSSLISLEKRRRIKREKKSDEVVKLGLNDEDAKRFRSGASTSIVSKLSNLKLSPDQNTTSYLVFNGNDVSQKPQLISFSSSILDEEEEKKLTRKLLTNSSPYPNDDSDFDADQQHSCVSQTLARQVKGSFDDADLGLEESDIESNN